MGHDRGHPWGLSFRKPGSHETCLHFSFEDRERWTSVVFLVSPAFLFLKAEAVLGKPEGAPPLGVDLPHFCSSLLWGHGVLALEALFLPHQAAWGHVSPRSAPLEQRALGPLKS